MAGCLGWLRSSTTGIGGCGNPGTIGRSKVLSGLEMKPSEVFKRQVYATFQEDHVAMSLLPFYGEGHVLWASDYPHPDSVWPNSRAAIDRQIGHLTPEMRKKLTHDNAAALYRLE